MQILEIHSKDRILIIAPHPDDECIGPGGILCLFPKQCSVLVLSDGREGGKSVASEMEKEIRKKEFIEEMHFLGINEYQMLGYKDGTLMKHTDCLKQVDLSKYTKIFVTGTHDNHPDHTAAYLSVYHALHEQEIINLEIYIYEVHDALQGATHMIDITNVIDKKQQIIRFHKSQIKQMPYDRYAKCAAQYRALQNKMCGQFIEVYSLVSMSSGTGCNAELEQKLQKNNLLYSVLTCWMELKLKGRNIAEVLISKGFYKVSVYGYAELGKLLCQEFLNTEVETVYILDRKVKVAEGIGTSVYMPEKCLPKVDAVVVTAVYYFDEIKESLMEMGFENIISLRELLEQAKTIE